ncbi:MAG: hypothetical protein ACEPOV_14625 [Hyphomicrobiales bacterium]
MYRFFIVIISLLFISTASFTQDYSFPKPIQSVAKSRKENLNKILDYRYKGGHWAFEMLINKNFKYPEMSIKTCNIGIVLVNIEVNCEGEITNLIFKNPLQYGIEPELKKVFLLTEGNWNKCEDDKYTKIEIPIQFSLKGTETNSVDPYITIEGDNPGYVCRGDKHYFEKAVKYLKKKKGKKALPFIDILIKRNPLTPEFLEMKQDAIKLFK